MNGSNGTLGPVVADLSGTGVSPDEHELLRHPALGGIILFTRNYREPGQVADLCAEIREVSGRNLLISVDQEGGRVQRFRDGLTRLPPANVFGMLFDEDPENALALVRDAAFLMAFELRELGVDLSFAPVADIDRGICEVIGTRAFHHEPGTVGRLCAAWRRGMRDAGMAAVAKHFPGHGAVRGDSHLETPLDERDFETIAAEDLVPFESLVAEGLEGIMTAHVRYPGVDPSVPTFSRFWLDTVLRGRMGFDGIVFSDDLTMAGAGDAGGPANRAVAALDAGCDAVLICNDPPGALDALNALDGREPVRSLERLLGAPWDGSSGSVAARIDRTRSEIERVAREIA